MRNQTIDVEFSLARRLYKFRVIMCEFNFRKGENMTYLVWLLRIIHIGAGVFWVGSALMSFFFIGPAVAATGEAGQKFMGYLMSNKRISARIASAAGSSILAGLILFVLDARAGAAWLRSSFAIGLIIGAGFALIGFVFGILVGRVNKTMAQLGVQMQGKPSAEQIAQMQALQNQVALYSRISAMALIVAVIFMAVARYLGIS
jgi:hypothetical protein